jgi:hypothetical protein
MHVNSISVSAKTVCIFISFSKPMMVLHTGGGKKLLLNLNLYYEESVIVTTR